MADFKISSNGSLTSTKKKNNNANKNSFISVNSNGNMTVNYNFNKTSSNTSNNTKTSTKTLKKQYQTQEKTLVNKAKELKNLYDKAGVVTYSNKSLLGNTSDVKTNTTYKLGENGKLVSTGTFVTPQESKSYYLKNKIDTKSSSAIETNDYSKKITGIPSVTDKAVEIDKQAQENKNKYEEVSNSDEAKQLKNSILSDYEKAKNTYQQIQSQNVSNKKVTTYNKTIGKFVSGAESLISEGKFQEQNEKGTYYDIPTTAELYNQKVDESYKTKIGKFVGTSAYEIGKISVSTLMNAAVPGSGTTTYFSKLYDQSYDSAVQNGADDSNATAYAMVSAATEAVTEKLLGGVTKQLLPGSSSSETSQILSEKLGKLINGHPRIVNTISNAISEGNEEFVQEFLDKFYQNLLIEGKGAKSFDGVFSTETFLNALYSGIVGAATGGFFGATDNTNYTKLKEYQTKQIINAVRQDIQNTSSSSTAEAAIKSNILNQIDALENQIDVNIGTVDTVQNQKIALQEKMSKTDDTLEQKEIKKQINSLDKQISSIEQQNRQTQQIVQEQQNVAENSQKQLNNELAYEEANSNNVNAIPANENISSVETVVNNAPKTSQAILQNFFDSGTNAGLDMSEVANDSAITKLLETIAKTNREILIDDSKFLSSDQKELNQLQSKLQNTQNALSKQALTNQINQLQEKIDSTPIPKGMAGVTQDGNTIYISSNNLLENLQQIVHESLHIAASNDSTIVDDINNYFEQSSNSEYQKEFNDIANRYAQVYKATGNSNYNPNSENFNNVIREEYAAIKFYENINTQEFVDMFVKNKPRTAVSIFNNIKEWLKTHTNKEYAQQRKFWNQVKEKFVKAFSKNGTKVSEDGDIKLSNKIKEDKLFNQMIQRYGNDYVGIGHVNDLSNYYIIDKNSNNEYTILEKISLKTKETRIKEIERTYDEQRGTNISENIERNWNEQRYNNSNNSSIRQEESIGEFVDRILKEIEQENNNGIRNNQTNNENVKLSVDTNEELDNSSFNLQKDSQGRTLTTEQQEYFKDSKVRDENGNLQVYYNGGGNYTVFDNQYMSDQSKWGKGIYLSKYEEVSKMYGTDVKKVYANITNPISQTEKTISFKQYNDLFNALYDEDAYREEYDMYDNDLDLLWDATNKGNWADYANELKKYTGKDGIIVNDEVKAEDMAIAFQSNQIKNVDNSNPTNNDDIRFSVDMDEWGDNKENPITISNLPKEAANTTPRLPGINVSTNYADGKSKFASNIQNKTNMLTDENKETILSDDEVKFYDKVTNKQELDNAYSKLNENGRAEVMNWLNKDSKTATGTDVAEGWILLKQYQDAIQSTDNVALKDEYNQSMIQVAKKMRDIGTKAGQTVQAFNILSRLTPEGMVYYAQSELNEAYDQMVKNKTQDWIDKNQSKFQLTPEETEEILDSMVSMQYITDDYQKKVKLAEIQKMISDKLPPEKGSGIKAWMRISMLFNPKTQVRNVTGNAIIAPVNWFGDLVGSKVDTLVAKKTGTRTMGTIDVKATLNGMKKGAIQATNDYAKGINTKDMEGNRFEIGNGKSFTEKTIIGKSLNNTEALLNYVMDAGDRVFSDAWYENSIANQLKLNNTTEITQDMIDIARQEALSRTWNDNNNYTRFVLNVRTMMNKLHVGSYGLGDVLIPFAKTPANLTKAIVDYSPVGLVNSLVEGKNLANNISTGTNTALQQHQFVQDLGKATAGTMLYVLGYALAKAGISSGESDDDKDTANFLKNTLGVSSYSIKIGSKTFTYDWAQPIAAPLSIMANIVNNKDKGASLLESIVSNLDSANSILLEQSFLQSLNDVLNGYGNSTENLINEILELPSRAIPTFVKQIADLTDGTQRQTYVKGHNVLTAINQAKAKIPGLSKTLTPSVDTMGREIQKYGGKNNLFNVFLNPANVNTDNISESAQEIYDVYQATSDKTIMPRVAPYSIDKDNEKINLTTEQRYDYQTESGETIDKAVSNLLKNKEYTSMSSKDKAEVLSNIVNYSYNIAQHDVLDTDVSNLYSGAYEFVQNGGKVEDYYMYKYYLGDGTKKTEVVDALNKSSMNSEMKRYIMEQKKYKNYTIFAGKVVITNE